jgi:hypothetical protein
MPNETNVMRYLVVCVVLLTGSPALADGPQRAAVPADGVIQLSDHGYRN